ALWHDAFLQEDYYFSTSSYVIVGQNVASGCTPVLYQGTAFAAPASVAAQAAKGMGKKVLGCGVTTGSCGADTEAGVQAEALVRPLCEQDLGRVMSIEIASFPDPWTPLAFAMEVRHNPQAHYNAVVLPTGEVVGYSGVWHAPDGAHLLRIAVDATQRGRGLGARLVDEACEQARIEGLNTMLLEVRANNEGAIAFYQKLGFAVVETLEAYYTNPTEDALVLCRDIEA
ncbi:MAG: ribosomal protein S18-alanine N-acetyltransferase, partial [Raoultibacter sp.]